MGTDQTLIVSGKPSAKPQIASAAKAPESWQRHHSMHMNHPKPGGLRARIRQAGLPGLLALCILFAVAVAGTGCTRSADNTSSSASDREAKLRQIASDYARSEDLTLAQAALDQLGVANPGQLLLSLTETDISAGRSRDEIEPLAQLVDALGIHSPKLVAYLAPTATPTATPVPPTATALPPTATLLPTATSRPLTPTPQPTVTPTAEPQQARVVATSSVNLRSGPGRAYPVVGQMRANQELAIIARNASGDWWQLDWGGQGQAWVAGTVVSVLGPIDTVQVAQNIPTPPPQPTATPRPTAGPTATPKPSTAFVVKSVIVRPVNQDSQRCESGEHNIFVTVIDPAGNPLDYVRVREIWRAQQGAQDGILVTGAQGKGPGRVEFDLYANGGGQLEIVDEANNPISPQTRGMSANLPDWDLFLAAGYCNCKPYPDVDSCHAGWEARHFQNYPMSHYVYEVVFQRTY